MIANLVSFGSNLTHQVRIFLCVLANKEKRRFDIEFFQFVKYQRSCNGVGTIIKG